VSNITPKWRLVQTEWKSNRLVKIIRELKVIQFGNQHRARSVLDMLANEEVEHLKAFFDHYKGSEFGDLSSYINSPANTKHPTYMKLEKAINEDMVEQKALELALIEEKDCIGQYTQLAQGVVDPTVRSVFERVVKETQGHYDLIESEYAHVMRMVHESDQDIYVRE
jgi:rubrerythrin